MVIRLDKIIGLWMMVLMVSLPIYSADVMAASIKVTKNTGDANVPGYINANGDTWKVEATVTGAVEVVPENVIMRVGARRQPFESCREESLGTVCAYNSQLTNGVNEDTYPFTVIYSSGGVEVTQSRSVVADGTAPEITNLRVTQDTQQRLIVRFNLADDGAGLKLAQIIDADTNAVMQEVEIPADSIAISYEGPLLGINSGQGVRRIKVRAVDNLGHESVSSIVSFLTDFVGPVVESMTFTGIENFIGTEKIESELVVDIREKSNLVGSNVAASSQQTNLENTRSNGCTRDNEDVELWHCKWNNVEVLPFESITIRFIATDNKGNTADTELTQTFTKDVSPPRITFFGTDRIYNDDSYIGPGIDNRLILRISEQGSGMDKNGIRADLTAVGGDARQAPTHFDEESYEAVWELDNPGLESSNIARVSLVKFQDKAGNSGPLDELGIVVDNGKPVVQDIEIKGISGSEGERNFLQSNDLMKIELEVIEGSGLSVLVNLAGLVNNAEVLYPEGGVTRNLGDGWRQFTQDDGCDKEGDVWRCEFVTEALRSGTGDSVDLDIRVRDTAGNRAIDYREEPKNVESGENGKYKIELLGVVTDEDPHYWELNGLPTLLYPLIDIDAAALGPTRMPMKVKLKSQTSRAELIGSSLVGCKTVGDTLAPPVRRALILGGNVGTGEKNPSLTLMMEFDQFNGRSTFGVTGESDEFIKYDGAYTCQLKIYSKIARNAVNNPEFMDFSVIVPFAFTENGALDESVASKVKELQDDTFFKHTEWIGTIEDVLGWVRLAGRIFGAIRAFQTLVSLGQATNIGAGTAAEISIIGSPLALAFRGGCLTSGIAADSAWEVVDYFQAPVALLTCDPSVLNPGSGVAGANKGVLPYADWLFQLQSQVLEVYNVFSGRDILGIQATSLYENFYTSAFGLCIPGIFYNIQKQRELTCRRIICYAQEVPAGITTYQQCDQLYDLQMCEFVLGPIISFFPGVDVFGAIGSIIQNAFSNPFGLVKIVEFGLCNQFCLTERGPGALLTACKISKGISQVVAIADSIAGMVASIPSVGNSYCDIASEIKLEELSGGAAFIEEEEESEPTQPVGTGSQRTIVDENQRVQPGPGADTTGRTPSIVNQR